MCPTSAFLQRAWILQLIPWAHRHPHTGVVGPHLPFSWQIKSLGDKSLQEKKNKTKQSNLSKSTPIQEILGAAKWILGVIIKQLICWICCSVGARKSRQVCGFQNRFCLLEKKIDLKTSWKNCVHFEVLGKQQTPRPWVGRADATMDFEHF